MQLKHIWPTLSLQAVLIRLDRLGECNIVILLMEAEMHRNTNLKKTVFSYAIYSKLIQDKYLNELNDFVLENKNIYILF